MNAKKRKAKVKEDVRRKWRVEKVVLKAIDPNQNVEGKLELIKETKYLERVLPRLQKAKCHCLKKLFRQVNRTVIQEVLKLLAEGKAVTKVAVLAAEESDLNPKVPVPQDPDRVLDQNPEVVPGVLHDRVRDQLHDHVLARVLNLDLSLDPCRDLNPAPCRDLGHGPGLDQAQNREVNRVREARRDQDQAQPRVDLVRGQVRGPDRVQERVNLGQGHVVVQGKADLNRDRDQDPQLADRDRDRDHPLVLGKLDHDRGQDQDPEAVRSRTNENPEAKADRNPNLCRDPDHVPGQRAVHEVVVPVAQHGLPLQNPGNPFPAATSVHVIQVQIEVAGARASKCNVRIEIISMIREGFTLIVHYTLLYG